MERRKLRAVVDTNLLVSSILLNRGYPHELVKHWRKNSYTLVVSNALVDELATTLKKPKITTKYRVTERRIQGVLKPIYKHALKTSSESTVALSIRDADDQAIIATALNGQVDYLVTGDKDLLDLKGNPKIGKLKIVTVKEFLEKLEPV